MSVPRTRVQRHPVHGVLLLDKPVGISSNQALQKAKWLLRAEKGGHTGTLDPLASGVLPLCFGAATKFSNAALDADKSYQALAQLGVTTTSADAEGQVLERRPVNVTQEDLERILPRFCGLVQQTPPMYSALKKDGRPLYDLARQGIEVEREARTVTIESLKLELQGDNHLLIDVTCSKGTYIRTLAQDIGQALGCGAHLRQLRRTRCAHFEALDCKSLQELEQMPPETRSSALLPIEVLLRGYEPITLDSEQAGRFLCGERLRGNWSDAPLVAVWGKEPPLFLGSACAQAGQLIAQRLLSPLELKQILKPDFDAKSIIQGGPHEA